MSSIFLSHSSKDRVFARRLARDLEARGIRVWVDEAEMFVGDSLVRKIEQAIREMEYLGVLLSPDSVDSEWVQREVEIALNHEIQGKIVKVLPILYKECEIPGFLAGRVWADFQKPSSYASALEALLRRLLISKSGAAPGIPIDSSDGIRVLNWNVGGAAFLESPPAKRLEFKNELNREVAGLIQRHHPDVVTLQEVTRYKIGAEQIEELITELPGYTYHPVPLVPSTSVPARSKWEKIREMGDWDSETYFARGNALLLKTDAPLFRVWDLPALGCAPMGLTERNGAIEQVYLESGLYFGDRDIEPRTALVAHFVYAPSNPEDTEAKKPLDVFIVNVQLSTLVGEREGLPNLDVEASSRRKAQLEVIIHGIISRYNNWRHSGYALRGQRRPPTECETFNRRTPMWILAGAFNFTENSQEYEYVKRLNFIDVVPNKGSGTKASAVGKKAAIVLDYIFAGPIVSMGHLIHANALTMNFVDHTSTVSDHFPIIATIRTNAGW